MPFKDKSEGIKYHKKYHRKWYNQNIKKRRKEISLYNKKYYPTSRGRYTQHKSNCKRRGLINELTLEQFTYLINSDCEYCGNIGHGIDRVDNSIGYLINNCVPCCTMCNYMKKNYTEEEFIEHCIKIVETYKQIN